ncbi:hypothetical protein JX265_000729 [Neoarthrinium moseri]|uniref:Metallo-beta-lactamase domain-containing protein n=1 Tax=Neoarthrinium moseri TaxID=1658444 RepID=A0A9P9WWV7_9PEZI|nr:uncharacterized protein JN550_013589 [Neoarthrinium moseri]KAI1856919.1 hypothetical protein JN550_013589 [Neoarthrinium moseri]KAI1880489.1 hypothetical protein JX265_000729 [Neoarthrinium moseri]
MSTFNGIVHEFPGIAIDFFRPQPERSRPPLACFLSHVHSDHLAGLETLRSHFIYCSAATREILLRLQKHPSRIAYANGLREAPVRTYTHLKSLLKAVPLDTPTVLELAPGNHIQVTLIDANHCPGAVMFLIEGNGKAVLYTGDIRSEPWWVNAVARNPCLVEYASGLNLLDRIYLDTSMLSNHELQTKAEGLKELLTKISKYPDDTVFCMQAWTYGYEEVWIALSKALKSKIHVDKYKMGVYKSLVTKSSQDRFSTHFHHTKEAPYLVGFNCGNTRHEGCLTLDENVRIHSCEKGTSCSVMQTKPIVWIQPIVAHIADGMDWAEVGLGGGGDDLEQEADVEDLTLEHLQPLFDMIGESRDLSVCAKEQIKNLLRSLVAKSRLPEAEVPMSEISEDVRTRLGSIIFSMVRSVATAKELSRSLPRSQAAADKLPNRITFPYARHSSYPELRHLVETFKPKDVWPCTVDISHWQECGITMRKLFGPYCSGNIFEYDQLVEELIKKRSASLNPHVQKANDEESQQTPSSACGEPPTSPILLSSPKNDQSQLCDRSGNPDGALLHESSRVDPDRTDIISIASNGSQSNDDKNEPLLPAKRPYETFREADDPRLEHAEDEDLDLQGDSQASALSARAHESRLRAYRIANGNSEDRGWRSIELLSTSHNHNAMDEELGSS